MTFVVIAFGESIFTKFALALKALKKQYYISFILFVIFGIGAFNQGCHAKVTKDNVHFALSLATQTVKADVPIESESAIAITIVSKEESETEIESAKEKSFLGAVYGNYLRSESVRKCLFKTLKRDYQNNHCYNLLIRFCIFLI